MAASSSSSRTPSAVPRHFVHWCAVKLLMSEPHLGQKLRWGGVNCVTSCMASGSAPTWAPQATACRCRPASKPRSIAARKASESRSMVPASTMLMAREERDTASAAARTAEDWPQPPMGGSRVWACAVTSSPSASASPSAGASAGAAMPSRMGFAPSSTFAIRSNLSAIERSSRRRTTSFNWLRSWPVEVMGPCTVRSWPQARQYAAEADTADSHVGQNTPAMGDDVARDL